MAGRQKPRGPSLITLNAGRPLSIRGGAAVAAAAAAVVDCLDCGLCGGRSTRLDRER